MNKLNSSPTENEKIEAILIDIQVERFFGIIRQYDIVFSERGLLFFLKTGALSLGIRQGVSGGVSGGLGGALPGGEGAFIGGLLYPTLREFLESRKKTEDQYSDIMDMLDKNKHNFYINYYDIKKVVLEKKWNGLGGMSIYTINGKIRCEFPKELLNEVSEKFNAKVKCVSF